VEAPDLDVSTFFATGFLAAAAVLFVAGAFFAVAFFFAFVLGFDVLADAFFGLVRDFAAVFFAVFAFDFAAVGFRCVLRFGDLDGLDFARVFDFTDFAFLFVLLFAV